MAPVVSIIIPVYNGEATLGSTLQSALAQTFHDVEVLVVDDGSCDGSVAVAQQYAQRDPRVRILNQQNRGVAAARNLGITNARGSYIAPLDADDLWHPDKILRQMLKFRAGDPSVGLVYNWYRRIDAGDIIIQASASPDIEGWVLHRHLEWNFISNGSTPLIRKSALADLWYSEDLRASDNQGCEDYLLQLELAKRCKFLCASAFLTGYRRRGGEMSSDVARMIRSHIQMYGILLSSLDRAAAKIAHRKIASHSIELARNRIRRGRVAEAADALKEAIRHSPATSIRHGFRQLEIALQRARSQRKRLPPSTVIGRRFQDVSCEKRDDSWRPRRSRHLLASLAGLDSEFGDEHRQEARFDWSGDPGGAREQRSAAPIRAGDETTDRPGLFER